MTFRPRNIPEHLYFVTATICGWKQILTQESFAEIVLNSLNWMHTNKRMKLYAFVIMPNHLHFVCQPIGNYNMSKVKQNFGSFTAHAILKELRSQKLNGLLDYFHQRAIKEQTKSQHKIWEDIQAKNIHSCNFLKQKIEYIHNNPVNTGWQLVTKRWQWEYSSASYYDMGLKPPIPIEDVRTLLI